MSKVKRSDKHSTSKNLEKERSRKSERNSKRSLLEKEPQKSAEKSRKSEKPSSSSETPQPQPQEILQVENSVALPEKPSKANNFQTLDSHIRHYIQCFESKMVKKMYESENRLKQHMDLLIENAVKNIIENQEECRVMCVAPPSAPPPRKKTRFDVEPQAEPYNWPTGEHPIENPAWPEGQLRVLSTHPQRFLMRGDPTTPFEVEAGKPKVNCIFCKLPHFSDCCPIIPDPLARREILKDEKRCMKCCGKLEGNHQCNTKPCRYCKAIGDLKSDHHSSICRVPKNIE
ncbi:unnamed protein product [Caenorhabditis angaria]|uniref:Uncharacterized protein n=1 Tax=Caenorhabditis angaria TaxID=860376 RepID=A0A9P1N221_9PELO|nr:unnamed protein product [Caenorhabditis angaria]